MRTSVKVGAALAGAALLASAAAVPASAKSPWTKTGASIVGTAVAVSGGAQAGVPDTNSGDFDLLVVALKETGAIGLFDGTEYTVFAPVDKAFIELADALDTGETAITTEAQAATFWVGVLSTDGGKALVTSVLAYHVVPGTTPARSVLTGRNIATLNGDTFRWDGSKLDGVNSDAGFAPTSLTGLPTSTNLKTTDGAIHVIDTVLLPTL